MTFRFMEPRTWEITITREGVTLYEDEQEAFDRDEAIGWAFARMLKDHPNLYIGPFNFKVGAY